jgi:hypothetical protein
MGHKHRDKRKAVKAQLRHINCGWHKNEYGELTKRLSKAEARRALLMRHMTEMSIIDSVTRRARDEICAVEDACVLKMIEDTVSAHSR